METATGIITALEITGEVDAYVGNSCQGEPSLKLVVAYAPKGRIGKRGHAKASGGLMPLDTRRADHVDDLRRSDPPDRPA